MTPTIDEQIKQVERALTFVIKQMDQPGLGMVEKSRHEKQLNKLLDHRAYLVKQLSLELVNVG